MIRIHVGQFKFRCKGERSPRGWGEIHDKMNISSEDRDTANKLAKSIHKLCCEATPNALIVLMAIAAILKHLGDKAGVSTRHTVGTLEDLMNALDNENASIH